MRSHLLVSLALLSGLAATPLALAVPTEPSVQCTEIVAFSAGAALVCQFNGATITVPVGCRYCAPLFTVWVSEGTHGVSYGSDGVILP